MCIDILRVIYNKHLKSFGSIDLIYEHYKDKNVYRPYLWNVYLFSQQNSCFSFVIIYFIFSITNYTIHQHLFKQAKI